MFGNRNRRSLAKQLTSLNSMDGVSDGLVNASDSRTGSIVKGGTHVSLKIVIVGSGGVGGYFGARLAAADNDVTFVARGAHFEAVWSHGLRVVSPLGDVSLPEVEVVDRVAQMTHANFVFLTVKLLDTQQALPELVPLAERGAAVISFQNGV